MGRRRQQELRVRRTEGKHTQGSFQSNDLPEKASNSQFTHPFLVALL